MTSLHYKIIYSVNTRNLPFGNGVLQTSPSPPAWTKGKYFDKGTKAPHRAFWTLGCDLLFGLGSFCLFFSLHSGLWGPVFCLDLGPFVFSFLCILDFGVRSFVWTWVLLSFLFLFPCWVFFFYLFIYLFIFPYIPRKDTTFYTLDVPLEWPIPMFGPPLESWFVLTTPCFWQCQCPWGPYPPWSW
jgi:hypothetical protein